MAWSQCRWSWCASSATDRTTRCSSTLKGLGRSFRHVASHRSMAKGASLRTARSVVAHPSCEQVFVRCAGAGAGGAVGQSAPQERAASALQRGMVRAVPRRPPPAPTSRPVAPCHDTRSRHRCDLGCVLGGVRLALRLDGTEPVFHQSAAAKQDALLWAAGISRHSAA